MFRKALSKASGVCFRTLDEARATGQDVSDPPESAICYDYEVQAGDLIVVATDGLWDNLFDAEVADLCGIALSPLESEMITGDVSMSTAPRVSIQMDTSVVVISQMKQPLLLDCYLGYCEGVVPCRILAFVATKCGDPVFSFCAGGRSISVEPRRKT